MRLHTQSLELSVDGATASAWLARPLAARDTPLPGIVVVQEVWGVDSHIRDLCERFAEAGYVAIAPALYSLGGIPAALDESRVERVKAFLDTAPPAVWMDAALRDAEVARLPEPERGAVAESLALLMPSERPWERYLAAVDAARSVLAAGPAAGRRIGIIGFCMGGLIAFRAACRQPAFAAAASFYGQNPADEKLDALGAPLLGMYAGEDPRVNATIAPFEDRMRAAGKRFEHHVYPGTRHAFFNDTRGTYSVEAARDAWCRTLTHFQAHLSAT